MSLTNAPAAVQEVVTNWRIWLGILSVAGGWSWSLFKAFQWVKEIRTKDMIDVKNSINSVEKKLDEQTVAIKGQTAEVVQELREQRADFRTFFAPIQVLPARARAVRQIKPKVPTTKQKKKKIKAQKA